MLDSCTAAAGVEPATILSSAEVHVRAAALVFLNGNILGLHRRPRKFVRAMRWVQSCILGCDLQTGSHHGSCVLLGSCHGAGTATSTSCIRAGFCAWLFTKFPACCWRVVLTGCGLFPPAGTCGGEACWDPSYTCTWRLMPATSGMYQLVLSLLTSPATTAYAQHATYWPCGSFSSQHAQTPSSHVVLPCVFVHLRLAAVMVVVCAGR